MAVLTGVSRCHLKKNKQQTRTTNKIQWVVYKLFVAIVTELEIEIYSVLEIR